MNRFGHQAGARWAYERVACSTPAVEGGTMLAFVTTIRHPDNAASFDRVGQLLDATLRSVCRQTEPDFCVIVVHNKQPPVQFDDSRIQYLRVDFPPPSDRRTALIGLGPGHRDKGYKNVIGAVGAIRRDATHVMFFDADDYVHRGLCAHANASPEHPGWYSSLGFIHTHGFRVVSVVDEDFDKKAGTTSILRSDLLRIPDSLTVSSSQDDIDAAMGEETAAYLFGSHDKWRAHLSALGETMEPLPFASAIWEIGTGENLSGTVMSGRRTVKIDDDIETAFGLAGPSYATHARAVAARSMRRVLRRVSKLTGREPQ